MSLISEQLKTGIKSREEISERIESESIQADEEEIRTTAQLIKEISQELSERFSGDREPDEHEVRALIQKKCGSLELSFEEQKRIEKNVLMTALGNGPIEPLLHDESVTEIIVQSYDSVLVERAGILEDTDIRFNNEEHLMTIINRIVQKVGRQINLSNPIVDARLEDGSRVNAIIPPASPDGPELVIRKFSKKALTGNDYISLGSMSREMLYFLNRCVTGKISIFISGSTGTGKTTLLNMLSSFIPPSESIITIEDTCELRLQQPRVRRREVREVKNANMMEVDQQALVKAALRQRPDRIILGETRDGSIVDMVSAMSTGHDGSMSTIHANSPKDMVNVRIPILYSKNKDVNFTERAINMQIASAIKLVCQIKRFGGDRKIDRISEIAGIDEGNGKVIIKDIFRYEPAKNAFCATGYIPQEIVEALKDRGIDMDLKIFQKPQSQNAGSIQTEQAGSVTSGKASATAKDKMDNRSLEGRFDAHVKSRKKATDDLERITGRIRESNKKFMSESLLNEPREIFQDILSESEE